MSTGRFYRFLSGGKRFQTFTVQIKETDLWIAVSRRHYKPDLPAAVEQLVWRQRRLLEVFWAQNPDFAASLNRGAAWRAGPCYRHGDGAGFQPGRGRSDGCSGGNFRGDCRIISQEPCFRGYCRKRGRLVYSFCRTGKNRDLCRKITAEWENSDFCRTRTNSARDLYLIGDCRPFVQPRLCRCRPGCFALRSPGGRGGNSPGQPGSQPGRPGKALVYARNLDGVTGALLVCQGQLAAWVRSSLCPMELQNSSL